MNIVEILGPHPHIEKPSKNYKRYFKKGLSRAERLRLFLEADDFQLFCQAEAFAENTLIQFCFNSDEEIRVLYGGKLIWVDGLSYRLGQECMADIKAPKFLKRLTSKQRLVYFVATYWLSRDASGHWHAELLLDDDAFLQNEACKKAFARVAALLGGTVLPSFLSVGKIKDTETLYRVAGLSLPDGREKLLAVSFDNGALQILEPETVELSCGRKGSYDVYRTEYNWFRGIGNDNFLRIV